MRRIRNRKHSAIVFNFEFHAVIAEPFHSITRTKLMKRATQFFLATRVKFHQFVGFKTSVSNVASSAARNTNFRQNFASAFENRYFQFWIFLYNIDCRKKSRSATAYNYNVKILVHILSGKSEMIPFTLNDFIF